ncbi:MAG: hypothetical protein QOG09_811 [Solirubrobacterales bacterium]|jgi:hypothetical protein|nr:hypothetical protein [Solirubrobacterales bacterium]MDX6662709.1 hypothetical protein [Solirubrobacterales bacterium]
MLGHHCELHVGHIPHLLDEGVGEAGTRPPVELRVSGGDAAVHEIVPDTSKSKVLSIGVG